MTRKHIIFVHGRSIKPSASRKKKLINDALMHGLHNVSAEAAETIRTGAIKCSFAYYGDINNAIMASHDPDIAARLTARNNKAYGQEPCLPHQPFVDSLRRLLDIGTYDEAAYNKVIRRYKDLRYLDDAARTFSTLLSVLTRSHANEFILQRSSADMGAYLMRRKVGSEVRERLQDPLRRAINARDDICIISHSMGCVVAYDVLWKFSQMSEYKTLQRKNPNVSKWLTLGCPLGEAGVRANLYDAREHAGGRFPKAIVRQWVNITAHDDFIAHDATMADDFAEMLDYGYVDSITDKHMYNCWVHCNTSNPHKLYGYLANQVVAAEIADWINR
jgi:hypothetical protein